jgi:hypothetical protein
VLVPFTVPKDAKAGTTLPITAKAQWLACTEAICVPEEAVLQGTVTVGDGPADTRFDGWRAALPAPLDRQGTFTASPAGWRIAVPFPASAAIGAPHFFIQSEGVADYAKPQTFSRVGDTLVIELAKAAFPAPEAPATLAGVLSLGDGADGKPLGGIAFSAAPGAVPTGGTPLGKADAPAPFSAMTLVLAILGALAGGLILNVMPCVFPILSLKAMALARSGSDHAKVEGVAYTAGVMLACMALGAAMLVAEWASTPAAEAMARLVGRNAAVCLVAIPSLAALPLALLLAALRRAAPASPVLAGGCAGATAAMLAATLYALHCTDDSPYFVLVWYALAALPPIGAGALFGARALDW